MITDDNLATAQIAQIFGSELLKVQTNAQTDSGAQPHIVNINPKQFLVNTSYTNNQRKAEEQRLLQMLQREAEAAHPLSENHIPPPYTPPPMHHPQPVAVATPQQATPIGTASTGVWERICNNLERIANSLEHVDFSAKKKRVKKIIK